MTALLRRIRVGYLTTPLTAISGARREPLRMHVAWGIHDTVRHAIEEKPDLEKVNIRRFV